jgi:hypothetical protein
MALGEFCAVNQIQLREVGIPDARSMLTLTSNSTPALDLMGQKIIALGDMDSAERFLQHTIIEGCQFRCRTFTPWPALSSAKPDRKSLSTPRECFSNGRERR